MADAPVLKRLEEIEQRAKQDSTYYSDSHYFSEEPAACPPDIDFMLRLTRALLESQGELMELAADCGHDPGVECYCRVVLARAERIQKGEV